MATLLQLKADIEELKGTRMKVVFSGASEAHLLAADIGESAPTSSRYRLTHQSIALAARAKVGVILNPVRPFPGAWDNHRM